MLGIVGDLIEDDYPFNFGGGDYKPCDEKITEAFKEFKGSINGFLVPHSGCIKKIILEFFSYYDVDEITKKIKDILDEGNLNDRYRDKFEESLKKLKNLPPAKFFTAVFNNILKIDIVKFEKKN